MSSFDFQKSERSVLIVIMVVIFIAAVTIVLVGGGSTHTSPTSQDSADGKVRDGMSDAYNRSGRHTYYYYEEGIKEKLFPFDPNIADSTTLLQLGLQPWQVRNIYKYRAHGGIYRTPDDFSKLYGLTNGQWKRLRPYIRISNDYQAMVPKISNHVQHRDSLYRLDMKIHENERIELNSSDTSELQKVPGIGHYYASQIYYYGQRLGGYCSTSQLFEIEDFPEQSLRYFIVDKSKIKKLDVNKLTINQLRRHPYINFYQAKAIVDYRRIRGTIKSLNDLRLLKEFPQEEIKRLEPYVNY